MPSRDYLIRQIEEMAIFLAILLRRILKMNEESPQAEVESVVKEALLQELKLDIDQVIILEEREFLTVVKEYFTSQDQLEKLANILKVLGQDAEQSYTMSKFNYLKKALFLFTYLQENTSSYSFERRNKIIELQDLIGRIGLRD